MNSSLFSSPEEAGVRGVPAKNYCIHETNGAVFLRTIKDTAMAGS